MTDPAAPPGPADHVRILVVDDDPGDVLIIGEALEESPVAFELTVASDGEEALELLLHSGATAPPHPHLVLLDLNLPRIGGHEVLARMKDDPALAAIPVVVLSTSSAPDDVARTYQLQGRAHVTKPVDYQAFHDVVRTIATLYLDVADLPSEP